MYHDCSARVKSMNTMSIFEKGSSGYESFQDFEGMDKIATGFKDMLALLSLVSDLTNAHIVTLNIMPQNRTKAPPSLEIVDWTSIKNVPIQIQLAARLVTFSPTKAYLAIGSSDIHCSVFLRVTNRTWC